MEQERFRKFLKTEGMIDRDCPESRQKMREKEKREKKRFSNETGSATMNRTNVCKERGEKKVSVRKSTCETKWNVI